MLTSLRTLVSACPTVQTVLGVDTKAAASAKVYDRFASDELSDPDDHESPLVDAHPRVILDDDLGRVVEVYGDDAHVVKGQLAIIIEYQEPAADWFNEFYEETGIVGNERDQISHAINMANRITKELKDYSRTEPGALMVSSIQNDIAIKYDEKEQNNRQIWALMFLIQYEGQL